MLTISSVRESISTRELTIIWRRVHNSRQAERCRAGSASRPRKKTSSGTAARSKSWRSSSRSEPSCAIPAIASSAVRSDSDTKTLRASSGRPDTASWAQESRTSAASSSRRSTIEPTTRRSAGSQRRRENASDVDRIRRRSLTWVLSVRMFAIIVAEQAFDMQAAVLTCGPPPGSRVARTITLSPIPGLPSLPTRPARCPRGPTSPRTGEARLRGEDPAEAVGERLRVGARMGQEVAHGVVDRPHHRPAEDHRILVGVELIVEQRAAHLLRDHMGESPLQLMPDLLHAGAESHGLDQHHPRDRRALVASDHEGADPPAHPIPMVVPAGRGGDDRVDELAALLRQDLAKALLLGIELIVKGGLGHARAGDDVIDRGLVITTRGEHRQRGLGQARAPLQASGFAWVDCVG